MFGEHVLDENVPNSILAVTEPNIHNVYGKLRPLQTVVRSYSCVV